LQIPATTDDYPIAIVDMYTLNNIDTFGDARTLDAQLTDLVTAKTATKNCSMRYNFTKMT